jgi:hypothetical protein
MGSPSIPAAPAAPDYGAANREAITTDISTLPLRNKINQAAQLGQKVTYQDPVTGEEKTADFTGMGNAAAAQQAAQILAQSNADIQRQQLQLRQELGTANARQTAAELRAADPGGYAARQALTDKVTTEFAGAPDYAAYVRDNGDLAATYEKETGKKLTDGDAAAAAEWGKKHYETYGQAEGRQLKRTAVDGSQIDTDTSAAKLNDRVRGLAGSIPDGSNRLGSIYDQATRIDTGATDRSTEDLGRLFDQARDEYSLGTKLDPDTERELLNQTRAGQAARGNFLGDAAAVAEATTLGQAGQAMKQQRLNNLLDVQNRYFGQTGTLRNEGRSAESAKLGLLSGLAGQDFAQGNTTYGNKLGSLQLENSLNAQQLAENRNTRNENYARDQQRLANASAMILGQPVTNQFGSLQSAQNGAVGAAQPINYSQAGQLNQNAGQQGASFAQGNYGTQAGIWGQQANIASQGNPWMALAGNVLGGAAGGFGAGAGKSLGSLWG